MKALLRFCLSSLVAGLLAGCASTAYMQEEQPDPLEPVNRVVFAFNEGVDRLLIKPLARVYRKVTPQIVDDRVDRLFEHLGEVPGIAASLLQGKVGESTESLTRWVYNSTFGLGGLFDVAESMGLPHRDEDFGQVLAVWTGTEGYYLVLPFLGPSSTLDVFGSVADAYLNPLSWLEPERDRYLLTGLRVIDARAGLLRAERAMFGTAVDRYAFLRDAYLQRRRARIYDGAPPKPGFFE